MHLSLDQVFDFCQSQLSRKLKAGAIDGYDLFGSHGESLSLESKDAKLDSFSKSQDIGVNFQVFANGSKGFSFSTSLNEKDLEASIQKAVELTAFLPKEPYPWANQNIASIAAKNFSSSVSEAAVSIDTKKQLALGLEAYCRELEPRIEQVRSAGFSESRSTKYFSFQTREGGIEKQIESKNMYRAWITAKASENGESQMGGDSTHSKIFEALDWKTVAKTAGAKAVELLGARELPQSGNFPVVIRNDLMAELIEFMSPSFSAENYDKKRSLFADKLGQNILAPNLTLIEDSTDDKGDSMTHFDGEGTRTQPIALVDGGKLTHLLTDQKYAQKLGLPKTASALRGMQSPPRIGVRQIRLKSGNKTFHDLLSSIHQGILLTELMGVHTANDVTGAFSLGASGFWVENGKIQFPIKGFAVAGNLLQLMKDIGEIGSDEKYFGSIGAPSVLIKHLSFSGKT